jgi:HK97 family phage prohead protease
MSEAIIETGELRWRTATQLGVSFPARTIELIVVPYEAEATVTDRGPKPVIELFGRGAFDGIERRANRIRVNRDHDLKRTVGRALKLHPSREEGLVAELRIAHTDLGDETLALADDGCLDASAGYRPLPGGEQWLTRSRVRVTKAWLGHIALTPDPAYETANVLAVRSMDTRPRVPRPNRERIDLERWEALYADLDARYSSG